MERHYPAVRLLKHHGNQGYGVAIRTGFQHAKGDLVFYTDSDRQFDIAEPISRTQAPDELIDHVGQRLRRRHCKHR